MAICRVCGHDDSGGNGHKQPPPTDNERCPKEGCTSKIKEWCPANHVKMCWKGHRYIGNEEYSMPE